MPGEVALAQEVRERELIKRWARRDRTFPGRPRNADAARTARRCNPRGGREEHLAERADVDHPLVRVHPLERAERAAHVPVFAVVVVLQQPRPLTVRPSPAGPGGAAAVIVVPSGYWCDGVTYAARTADAAPLERGYARCPPRPPGSAPSSAPSAPKRPGFRGTRILHRHAVVRAQEHGRCQARAAWEPDTINTCSTSHRTARRCPEMLRDRPLAALPAPRDRRTPYRPAVSMRARPRHQSGPDRVRKTVQCREAHAKRAESPFVPRPRGRARDPPDSAGGERGRPARRRSQEIVGNGAAHEGAGPRPSLEIAFVEELIVGRQDRQSRDAEILRQGAGRGTRWPGESRPSKMARRSPS